MYTYIFNFRNLMAISMKFAHSTKHATIPGVCQPRPIILNIEFIFYKQIYLVEFALREKRKWVVYLETQSNFYIDIINRYSVWMGQHKIELALQCT